jgi:hypothetical protein
MRRLRPDMFIGVTTLPSFTVVNTTPVVVDPQYRVALVYYVCGFAQLRDDEHNVDQRAGAFLAKFTAVLTGLT